MTEKHNAVSRRRLLRMGLMAAPVAGAAMALPALAKVAGKPEDPIMPLFRDWVAARREWWRYADVPGNEDWDMPESLAAEARGDAALAAMLDMTPTSMAGIAALAVVLWNFEGPAAEDSEEFAAQCDWSTNRIIRAIYRGASGKNELPPQETDFEGAIT